MKLDSKKIQADIHEHCNVAAYLSHREYLKDIYELCKKLYPSFSHKDFAEFLGFSRSNNTVRLVISGHRILTIKSSKILCQGLGLKHNHRRYFLMMVEYASERIPIAREEIFSKLIQLRKEIRPNIVDEQQLDYFEQWYHPVLREVLQIEAVDKTPEGIQAALAFPLRLDEIKKGIELLEKLGLIRFDNASSKYTVDQKQIWTEDCYDSLALTRYHQKMIEIAKESLTRIKGQDRLIEAVTISVSEKAVSKLKEKIDAFLTEAMELENEQEDQKEVYQVNLQLFPFTKVGEEK